MCGHGKSGCWDGGLGLLGFGDCGFLLFAFSVSLGGGGGGGEGFRFSDLRLRLRWGVFAGRVQALVIFLAASSLTPRRSATSMLGHMHSSGPSII